MKFALFLIVSVFAFANAELEIFVKDKEIHLDEETLKRLDVTHVTVQRGEDDGVVENLTDLQKNIVEDSIKDALEKFRSQLHVGFPEYGIPPLDPFKRDIVSFKYNQPYLFKVTLNLEGISVTGLQKFITEKVVFKFLGMKLEMGIDIPELVYRSDFGVKGRITIVIPFHFGGAVRMKLKHFRIATNVSVSTTLDGYLKLKYLQLDMSAEKTSIKFTGIIGDGPINEIANWILNIFTNSFIKEQISAIADVIADQMFDVLSDILGNIKITDIIG